MNFTGLGLTVDAYTWPIALSVAVLWWLTLRLVPSRLHEGWAAVPMSLFGFAWINFGLNFILRFFVLSCDSMTYGNMTTRLADIPAVRVNDSLILAGVYWLCLCVSFTLGSRRSTPGLFRVLSPLLDDHGGRARILIALLAVVSLLLSSGFFEIPLVFLTPLGLLGSLWVIPAALAWWEHFRKSGPYSRSDSFRWWLLAPGLIQCVLSPYRERILLVALVPLVSSLFAGKRYRLFSLSIFSIVLLLGSTLIIESYRRFAWYGESFQEVAGQVSWDYWKDNPSESPWHGVMRRFHGLDSLLLTVDLVPDVFAHSNRSVFLDSIVRGFVPRAIYFGKDLSDRGWKFNRTVWSYHGGVESEAAIAPSMPGDLYEAGGFFYVLLGGIIWGGILGFCEGWKRHLPPSMAAAVTVLFAIQCGASIERDYAHTVATVIQTVVVMVVFMSAFLRRSSRRQHIGAAPPVSGLAESCPTI